ncbi:MAG: hypothetical protein RLZZ227_570 [Pseudomonadota bacterium]|jgi:hypothetical protein
MKLQFVALAMILGTSFAAAESAPRLVNADGSALSNLCIVAAQSGTIASVAAQLDIPSAVANDVRCNNMSIQRFVAQYRAAPSDATVYAISVANEAPETRLCVAALTSAEEFTRLKDALFADVVVEDEIACNGRPLSRFVRRYQNRLAALHTAATASR